jgi:tRNA(Ile)-lysidine synthase
VTNSSVIQVSARSRPELAPAGKMLSAFPPSNSYLIGVSGGRDSIALLHFLGSAGYQKLVICHLDHQLRGRSSTADARFVENLGRSTGLDCEIGGTDVRALAGQSKVSVETAARIARFGFFVAVARRRGCRTIFLAHQADDLVETVLLNFFRGASPGGIASLQTVSVHRVGKTELKIVRPFLNVWRSEIDAYVAQHHLAFREDRSNAQLVATRNRIRHRILPYIQKEFGRDVRRAVWRAAQIWNEEETVLAEMLDPEQFEVATIELKSVQKLPVALQRRLIVRWLRWNEVADVNFDVVEKIRELIEANSRTANVNLARNRHARRRAGRIFLT